MLYKLKHFLHKWGHLERYRLLDELLHNQSMSKSQLLDKQKQAYATIVQYAYGNTPYYREKYRQLFESPASKQHPDNVPVLSKDEVVQHRDEMLAQHIDPQTLCIGNTGGSTGKPVSFYYDQHKHELMRAGMCRSYMWSGWKPGMKILNFWGAQQDIEKSTSLRLRLQGYIAAEKTIAAYEHSEEKLSQWARHIGTYQPVLVQGYASILTALSRYILNNKLAMPNSILGIYSTAEVLYDEQREVIEQAFGCKVFNQYGSREIPNIACECRYGNMHIFTDMVCLESQTVGQQHRLLVTSLTNRVMPMIRYDIGDSGTLKEGDCKCGSPFPMMKMELCRSNDLIKTGNGKIIHPSYFNGLLYGHTEISQYQYIQEALNKITLNIVASRPAENDFIASLGERIHREVDGNMSLEINYVAEIKRTSSGKHRFVISTL